MSRMVCPKGPATLGANRIRADRWARASATAGVVDHLEHECGEQHRRTNAQAPAIQPGPSAQLSLQAIENLVSLRIRKALRFGLIDDLAHAVDETEQAVVSPCRDEQTDSAEEPGKIRQCLERHEPSSEMQQARGLPAGGLGIFDAEDQSLAGSVRELDERQQCWPAFERTRFESADVALVDAAGSMQGRL